MAKPINVKTLFKLLVLIVWALLFGALLKRDYFVKTLDIRETQALKQAREESFLGVYFGGERIGYVKNRLASAGGGGLVLHQEAFLRLNILNENHPINMQVDASLTQSFLLEDFAFRISAPFYKMSAKGLVEGNTVRFTLATGKDTIIDSVQLSRPPFLSTNQRGYLLQQGLEAGEKIKIPYFDPISLTGKDTVLEYKGKKKTYIRNRSYLLHHFVETFSGVKINSWLDDDGKVIREESPAGFLFLAEPEFKATDIVAKGREILSTVSVPVQGTMPDNIDSRPSMSYRLTLPEDAEFLIDGDRQTLNGDIVTVVREHLPGSDSESCSEREPELASTLYIQASDKKITDLAKSLIPEDTSAIEQVEILAKWVYTNLEKRPVIGIPDALTTLRTKKGDCNEHAALFTALARSIGIPARITAGVTFHEGAFYYHAWNEVCINDAWISLDTTKDQLPADITHIKFVTGEIDELLRIGALLGNLQIEVVEQGKDH